MSAVDDQVLEPGDAGRRFLRGSGLRIAGYSGGLVLGVTVTPFVTRHLGSVAWGRYITVTSLLFIVATVTEGGLSNLGIRELSTGDADQRREYMRSLLGLRLVLTVAGALVAVGFALVAGYRAVLVEGTAIASLGLLLNNLQYTLAVALTARLRLGWLAVNDFLGQAVTATVLIALVISGASLLPFYAVSAVAGAASLMLVTALVCRDLDLRPSFRITRWHRLLSESFVYAAATALGVVYFQIVVIAVSLLTSGVQSGYFGLGFRVLGIVNGLPWLLVTGAFPILARAALDDAERLRYALGRLFEGGLILGGALALALVVGAPFVVSVVGGPEYSGSIPVLRMLGAAIPGTFLVATWAFALLTLKCYRELVVVNGLAVALAAVLSVVLVPAHGAIGASIVTVTLEVALASGYGLVLLRRRPDLRPPFERVPRLLLANGIAFAVALAVSLPPLPATAVGGLVLALSLLALGLVPMDLIHALTERSQR